MTTNLATKQDFQHHEQLMATRLEALESRMLMMFQNQETRIVVKLGVLMTVLFGVAGTVLTLVR